MCCVSVQFALRSTETEKRLIVMSCRRFVVGLVVIDHVILVKCTSHRLSVIQFAQPNLEIGQRSNSTLLNMCATFSEMADFEMPSWGKREEAPQGQGRRAVRQAVAEGRSERDVTRRLVDELATLSLVNAAELKELTATVFRTYLVPGSESVSEAMAEAGRIYHEFAGAIKSKPEAQRADAQEQLGLPYVHEWVAFLCSLAATRELAPEHVAVLKSYWESNVVKSAPVQLPLKGALEAALQLQKGVRSFGPAPRGLLEREASRLQTQMRGKWSVWRIEWNNTVYTWR